MVAVQSVRTDAIESSSASDDRTYLNTAMTEDYVNNEVRTYIQNSKFQDKIIRS